METIGTKPLVFFDPLYGHIHLTPVEREIIATPFYQRLRWINQLGFSHYVFPGAEHSRYGHSIGVMFNAHHILKSIRKDVPGPQLMDSSNKSDEKVFHQSIRLGALMHDLGTFCFSHTTEQAYINYDETSKFKNPRGLKDDHENLGSFIIKNTDYPGGITHILKKYGYDPQMISDLVKGVDPSILANQILHSEVDCDRMDYLLRDAHYTGLQYGSYDRDYLLYHFTTKKVGKHEVLAIKQHALHCVEDFLSSRFAWYSQVIRSPKGAKYDAIAERLTMHMLERGLMYRYSELLELISTDPKKFWGFNDHYFMGTIHRTLMDGKFDQYPDIKDMAETLLFAKQARHIRSPEFRQVLLDQNNPTSLAQCLKKAEAKVAEIEDVIRKKGKKNDWIIVDLPRKPITFVKSHKNIVADNKSSNVLFERDPVKILLENGEVKLLSEMENSTISRLSKTVNFIPNVFVSQETYDLLVNEGVIENIISSSEIN